MSVTPERPSAHVVHLRLDDPPANALGEALLDRLDAALDALEGDAARVVVVSSAVPRFFVAGADLKLLAALDPSAFAAYLARLRAVLERLARLPQTSIAAVDGMALGGGLELAMACTMRVASPRARLGLPEVKLGLLPGAAGTQRIVHLAGASVATDLLVTGRAMRGDEAAACGLVNRLADDPEAAALELAVAIARHPRDATAAARRCVTAALPGDLAAGTAVELRELLALFDRADAREGIAAFIEKREPTFA